MNRKHDSNDLLDFLIKEAGAHFSGWDFSYIEGRQSQAPLRWSYISECLIRVRKARALLDMDTGGGEIFSRFAPFPPKALATEAYLPNIRIARERLEPLGVKVVALEEEEQKELPFDENFFDLVLNRHGYYWPKEVRRIIQPGGIFITQQVGNRNDVGIRQLLSAPDPSPIEEWDDLTKAVSDLEISGFKINKAIEDFNIQRFYDIGAIVYQLKAIPWQIPDFSVESYFDRLMDVHQHIEREGFVDVLEHRFFIIATVPE